MIQYTDDFTGVTYVGSDGNPVTVLFTDGAEFNRLVATRDQQLAAANENKTVADNYNRTIKNDQLSEDASRPYPAPPEKPKKTVVSDFGLVAKVDFGPGELLSIVPKGATVPSSGSIKSTGSGVPVDPNATVIAQNTVILAQLKAIMGALVKAGLM